MHRGMASRQQREGGGMNDARICEHGARAMKHDRDPLPFPVAPALFPVEHRFLDIDGARIHYVDEGAGETVLLLHGNPTWSFLYRKIIAELRGSCRCVAL